MKITTFFSVLTLICASSPLVHADLLGGIKDSVDSLTGGGKHHGKGGSDPLGGMMDFGNMSDLDFDKMLGGDPTGDSSTEESGKEHHHHHKKHDGGDQSAKKHHHHDKDKDGQGHAKKHDDDGGVLGALQHAGSSAIKGVGSLQDLSDKVNQLPEKIVDKTVDLSGKALDLGVGLNHQVMSGLGLDNNIVGQLEEGIVKGSAETTKQVLGDLATFEKLYMKYMMGSGVFNVIMSSMSKNIKASLQAQGVDPAKATQDQLSGALQSIMSSSMISSLKSQGVTPEKATSDQMMKALKHSLKEQGFDKETIKTIMQGISHASKAGV